MLTGDEKHREGVFRRILIIKDAGKYLFNIRNPEGTVKAAAESAMREVIGRSASQEGRCQERRADNSRRRCADPEYSGTGSP